MNSVSESGVNFNKFEKGIYSLGLRTDGSTNKLFGVRPKTIDNHNYQFEVTFNQFVNSETLIANTIDSNYKINENEVQLGTDKLLKIDDVEFKHCINIDNLTDEVFIGEYIIDYTGFKINKKNLENVNLDKPLIKGIKVVDYKPTDAIMLNDFEYNYMWYETYEDGEKELMCSDSNLVSYINNYYPNITYNNLISKLSHITEPIYWKDLASQIFLTEEEIKATHKINGVLKFESNNFLVDNIYIEKPKMFTDSFERNDVEAEHLCILYDNNIRYFKIPSIYSIITKQISINKWLDVNGSLTGGISYSSTSTNSISNGNLCLLSTNLSTSSTYTFTNGGIVAGVSDTTGTTITQADQSNLPTSYPYLATVPSTSIAKIIKTTSDRSALITYADTDTIVYYTFQTRNITMTGALKLFNDIGTTSSNKSGLFAYVDMFVGSSSSQKTINNISGCFCNNIYTTYGNFEFNNVNMTAYYNNTRTASSIGGYIGKANNCVFNDCSYTHTGNLIINGSYVGGCFAYANYAQINGFTHTYNDYNNPNFGIEAVDNCGMFIANADYADIQNVNIIGRSSIHSDKTISAFTNRAIYTDFTNINMDYQAVKIVNRAHTASTFGNFITNCNVDKVTWYVSTSVLRQLNGSQMGLFIRDFTDSTLTNSSIYLYFSRIRMGSDSAGFIRTIPGSTLSNNNIRMKIGSSSESATEINGACSPIHKDISNGIIENSRYDLTLTNCKSVANNIGMFYSYNTTTESNKYVKNITFTLDGAYNVSGGTYHSVFGNRTNNGTYENITMINNVVFTNMDAYFSLGTRICESNTSTFKNVILVNTGTIRDYNNFLSEGNSLASVSDTTDPSYVFTSYSTTGLSGSNSVNYNSISSSVTATDLQTLAENWPTGLGSYDVYPMAYQSNGVITSYTETGSTRASSWSYNSNNWNDGAYYSDGSGDLIKFKSSSSPTLSAVSISSDNASASIATEGDIVTVSFTSIEPINIPTVTINSTAVTPTGYGISWSASYTVQADDTEVPFTIDFSSFNSRTSGTQVTATTDSSSVTVTDGSSLPTLTSVSIASDNSTSTIAIENDVITLTFTASETINTPTVTINSSSITPTNTSGDTWTASYTVLSTDTGSTAFTINFTSSSSSTNGIQVTSTTDSSAVTMYSTDNDKPTLTSVSIASDNSNTAIAIENDVITLTFTASETINNITTTINSSSITPVNTTGNTWTATYTVLSTDTGSTSFTIDFSSSTNSISGTQVTSTTDSSAITMYSTANDKPTLTSVSIASNNSDTTTATEDDVITLTFTASETITTPTVTINSTSVTPTNTTGNTWTATYTVLAEQTGTTPFTIDFTSSTNAISGTQVTSTTDSSSVTMYYTVAKPTLTSVSIASDNDTTTMAVLDDVITLTFTASETINTPTVTMNSSSVTPSNTTGDTWTASYTVVAADTGAISFTIDFTSTSSSKHGVQVTSTTDSSAVTMYSSTTDKPTLSSVSLSSDNSNTSLAITGDTITLTFTTSEATGTPTVTINETSVTPTNTTGYTWTASYTTLTYDSGATAFTVDFTSTLTGYSGTQVTSTTDSSLVTMYSTTSDKPLLSGVTIASDNSNSSIAIAGDIITLTINSNESITTPTITMNSSSITPSGSGTSWTASYTVLSSDSGNIAFTVDFTSSSTGITGSQVTSTTNSSSVTMYSTTDDKPTLSSVTISSNNSNNTLAKEGDVVTLSFVSNENISTPTVTINSSSITPSGSGSSWSATYTVPADTTGTVAFTIDFTSSLTSIGGTQVTSTTNSSSVTMFVQNTSGTQPTLSSVSIASDNSNSSIAIAGDVITLSFTSSESINTPYININGSSITASGSGTSWSGSYTVLSSDSGSVSFAIDFSNTSSIYGDQVTTTTDSSAVTMYSTTDDKPTLSSVSIASDNSTSSIAVSGDVITLTFTASETISSPTVTMNSSSVTASNTTGNTWTTDYTVQSSDDGVISFTIDFASSLNSISGSQVTSTTNSSSVTMYSASSNKPTLSSVTILSNNSNSALAKEGNIVTLSFTSSQSITTPTVTINSSSVTPSGSGTSWSASYIVQADETGTVPFTIDFTSSLTNISGDQVTSTTNSSSVTMYVPDTSGSQPTLSSVSIASDNSTSTIAVAGDIITVSFTSSESINTPYVTINNTSVTASGSGTSWSGAYTVQASDSGSVSFAIDFSNTSNIYGNTVSSTTDSSAVTMYSTTNDKPTLSSVSIASNNSNSFIAIKNNVITLSFTSSETINTPTVTINSSSVTPTNTTGNTWTATYIVLATSSGTATFTIDFTSSLNGISGTQVTSVTNGSSVTMYSLVTDKPTLSSVVISSDNDTSTMAIEDDIITLSFTASESINTPTIYMNSTAVTPVGSGTTWVAYYTVLAADTGSMSFSINFSSSLTSINGSQVLSTTNGSTVTMYSTTTDKPTLSSVSITSDNSNSSIAIAGDILTLTFTASETINTPYVNINSKSVTPTNTTGNTWTATYTVLATSTGTASISIGFKSSSTKISGTIVTSTTDSSSVTMYSTTTDKPTLSSVSISSDGYDTSVGILSDTITLTFTASETIGTPTVTMNSSSITPTNTSGNTWTADYTVISSDSGVISYTIDFTSSTTSISGTQVTSSTDSSSVTMYSSTDDLPTLTSVSISSDNSNNTLAKEGDTITLTFTASESIDTPTVVINSESITPTNTSGNTWTGTYTVPAATSGSVGFTIDFDSSITYYSGTQVTTTTDSSSVTMFVQNTSGTQPTLSSVSIASDNSNTSIGVEDDVITLTFTASETINTPYVNINGSSITSTNTTGNTWTATYTVLSSDSGSVSFAIDFSNSSSIYGDQVTTTTDSSAVTMYSIDTQTPILSSVTIGSSNDTSTVAVADDVITLTFTASEGINTPTVTINSSSITPTNTTGNIWTGSYTVLSSDTGSVSFSIDFSSSTSGISGSTVTTSTDSTSVTMYSVAANTPTLTIVSLASNNSVTTRAVRGNKVILSFTSSESISIPTVTINSTSVLAYGSGTSWTASYVVSSTNTGSVSFTIDFSSSVSGLSGTQVTSTTNSSSVTMYSITTDKPTLSSVSIASDNLNNEITVAGDIIIVSFTSNENIDTPTVTINSSSATVSGSGTSWSASYTTGSSDTGVVSFTIAFTSTISGISGTSVTSVTDSSSVTMYSVANDKPTLSSVSIASDNSNNEITVVGDIITVSFTSSESIDTPIVTINSSSATVSGSGTSWSATYTTQSADSGSVSFTIDFDSSLTGISGSQVTSVTDSSSVTMYSSSDKATLTSVSITSNNNNSSRAKESDTVTLTFTASESISTPTVTINSSSITPSNTSGNIWTASYTVPSSTTGVVPFTIDFSSSLTGISGDQVTSTTDSSSVTMYVITTSASSPTLSSVSISSNNDTSTIAVEDDVITLVFIASESISTPYVSINDTSVTASGSGTLWYAQYTVLAADTGSVSFAIDFTSSSTSLDGVQVTSTTNSSSVTMYSTITDAPTLTSVSISSDNSNTYIAVDGDVVTLTFTASESINTPTVTMNSVSVTPSNTSGNTWSASYTLDSYDSGVLSYTIDFVGSSIGLVGSQVTSSTDSTSVTMYSIYEDKPTLTSVSIASNNSTPSLAYAGQTVTLTFTASGSISTPTVTMNSSSVTPSNTSGNTWTASYTVPSNTEKLLSFTIDFASSVSGISGDRVISTTDSTSVTMYVVFNLSTITIASNGSDTTRASTDDIVTLSFTATHDINTPTVTMNGDSVSSTGSGKSWSAAYTVQSDDSGKVRFTIDYTRESDSAVGTRRTTTTNSSAVLVIDDVVVDADLGSVETPVVTETKVTYEITLTSSSTSPATLISNLSTLKSTLGSDMELVIKYTPRSTISANTVAREFKVFEPDEEITSVPETGIFILDDSGSFTLGESFISYNSSSISVDNVVVENNDYSLITFADGSSQYFYFLTGSLEMDEAAVSSSSSSGDPHIYPLYGNMFELPARVSNYRMLQGDNILLNLSTRGTTRSEDIEIKKFYEYVNGGRAPNNLVSNGVFYHRLYLNSEGHQLFFDYLKGVGSFGDKYFNVNYKMENPDNMGSYEKSMEIKQIIVTFRHSYYGKMIVKINYFDNPQIKYGVGLSVLANKDEELNGLLMRECLVESMELDNLFDYSYKEPINKLNENNSYFMVVKK